VSNLELFAWLVPIAPLIGCIVCAILSFRGDTRVAHLPAITSLLVSALCALAILFQWNSESSDTGFALVEGYRYLPSDRYPLLDTSVCSDLDLGNDRNLLERVYAR
jgi:NADH:ubiquinone oxidoreductase subunit 5 (subunit L)/multisubunit Na+/H+ antiporter MnhA subunit